MAATRIERIQGGKVTGRVERHSEDRMYHCHLFGSNVASQSFNTLDEVVTFLRANPRSGVRVQPGWSKVSRNLYVDGVAI